MDDEDFKQVAAAWAITEHLRRILGAPTIAVARNARIDFELAANTSVRQIKRTGRGFRNQTN